MKAVLNANHLNVFTPDGRPLISGLSLSVERGQISIIEGVNGAGKSSLLRALAGLYRHCQGQIQNTAARTDYLPQLADVRFMIPLTLADVATLDGASLDDVRGLGLLPVDRFDSPWNTASGGERQKALLSRSLLSKADLILLDEPLNHLDPDSRKHLLKILGRMSDKGVAIVIVAHGLDAFPEAKRLKLEVRT